MMRWEVIRSEITYRCGIFSIRCDHSRSLRSGQTHDFHVLQTGDWVNVVPITPERRVVLVRQFRHGIRNVTLEVPAGLIDETDPSPSAAAARELREETGYAGGEMRALGVVHPNPAIMNNRCHMFVAAGVRAVGAPQLDHTEELEVEAVPVAAIPQFIRMGRISNALTLVAFQLLQLREGDVAP